MKKYISFNRLVVFLIAVGYLILAWEIYLQHYDQLNEKKIMWVPIVFGLVSGFLGILITMSFQRVSYYLFVFLMSVSICVGGLGIFLHNRWRGVRFRDFLLYGKPFDFEILTTYTPLLAPSAFVAIGILGIMVAYYFPWYEKKIEDKQS